MIKEFNSLEEIQEYYDKDYDTGDEDREYAEELAFLRKQYQYCKSFLKERGNN